MDFGGQLHDEGGGMLEKGEEKKLYESGSSARLTIVNVVGNLLVLLLKVETWSGRLKMQCMNEISNTLLLSSYPSKQVKSAGCLSVFQMSALLLITKVKCAEKDKEEES
ncbi:unnamed protein product [Prunus armeniaca]